MITNKEQNEKLVSLLAGFNLPYPKKVGRNRPSYGGVYFLVADNEIEYIGQAKNFKNRLNRNHHKLASYHKIYIVRIDDSGPRNGIEAGLIAGLQPPLNGTYKKANSPKYRPHKARPMSTPSLKLIGGLVIVVFLVLSVVCNGGDRSSKNSTADNVTSTPIPASTKIPTQIPTLVIKTPISQSDSTPTTAKAKPSPTELPPGPDLPVPESTQIPIVTVGERNVNLRSGPGTEYEVIASVPSGQILEISGRNADSTWWQVDTPIGIAWVAASVVTASSVDESIPLVETPFPLVQATSTSSW